MHIPYAQGARFAPRASGVDSAWSLCRRRRLDSLTGWRCRRRSQGRLHPLPLGFRRFRYLRYTVFLNCILITFQIENVFYFYFKLPFRKISKGSATKAPNALVRPQTLLLPPPSWKPLASTSAPDPWTVRPHSPNLSSLSFTAIRAVQIFTVYCILELHNDYF